MTEHDPSEQDPAEADAALSIKQDYTEQLLSIPGLDISERQHAEEVLRLYQRIVADSSNHISILDRDYVYRLVNPAYLGAHGLTEEAIIGHSVADLFGQAVFQSLIKEKLDRCLAGETVCYQAWFEFSAHGRRYMDVTYTPYRDHGDSISGAIVSARDITELRLAEEALADSEARNRAILDTAVDGILVVDESNRMTYANPAISQLTGYSHEELQNRLITDLMPERFRDRHDTAFKEYLRTGHPRMPWHQLAFVLQHRDGHDIPVEVSIGLHHGAGRHQFIGILRDVTERRQGEERLHASQQMLQHVINTVPHFVFWKDRDSRYLGCNEAFARLGGMEQSGDLIGKSDYEMNWHRYADLYRRDDLQVMENGITKHNIVEPLALDDGHTAWLETSKVPLRDSQDRVIGVLGVFQDITERRAIEDRLRQSAEVFESTTNGIAITDRAANIIAVNHAFTEITGYTEAEVLGKNPRLLQSGRHDEAFYQGIWKSITQTGAWSGEITNRRKNGEVYPEWLTISSVKDDAGNLSNYVGVFADISQIKQFQDKLEHLAHYDPLTDLPNRLLLSARLDHAIERAGREHTLLALLFIDLDRFKTVNDGLGHPAGDRLLQAVAQRLVRHIRAEDTVARLGGDEFVLALEGLDDTSRVSALAEKLLVVLTRPFDLDGQAVFIGASIGISTYPVDGKDAATLLKNADAAMYRSKEDGRNTYRFYNAEMTRSARERLTLETSLRQAIERNEFVLHYQPQVDVASGEIVGVEALVRWDHPESGMIAPVRFIPLAEETGLIVPLGEWVLFTACTQAKIWMEDMAMPPFSVAVNLSPRQFRQANLVAHVRAVMDATGIPPGLLELEITESAVMEDADQAVTTLRALKELGIRISIDDFGTGYSSLAYLKRFPIDKLKIDQSFMRDIPQDQSDMEIAATIIAMSRNLHLKVLAEGVETKAQLDFLRGHGCDAYQGYFCSRPLAAPALEQWLAQRPPIT